jgi:hypothetical protein
LFESEEGERILRLITQLSATQNHAGTSNAEPSEPADPAEKTFVGIGEAVDDVHGRSFVRVETGERWYFWANVQKIPPKGSRRRIVLVGESVARGLLYDPQFNPALALQAMMNAACGASEIEVIDLARTDLSQKPLLNLLSSALHLEPDALIASLESLITKEHGVKDRAVNLVHSFYSTGSFARSLLDERPEFYRATERNTTFPLVCDKPQPLNFALTVKVPDIGPDQTISLLVNGTPLVQIPASGRWTTETFSAPANLLCWESIRLKFVGP